MRCGVMDQFASCRGATDRVLLLDCRSLDFRLSPVDPSVRLVICNSMVHHELAGSEYNQRREQCEDGVARLKTVLPDIRALRDVTAGDLARHGALLSELVLRRCRHVITENDRVQRAAAALEAGAVGEVGRLMNASHVSMRDDYEISCREIDILVELAGRIDGVLGARMTGGGFGGCTVTMVREEAANSFADSIARAYEDKFAVTPRIYPCKPSAGAAEL